MNRRDALSTTGLALASSLFPAGVHFADVAKPKRAGLIGCGWYGKCDLFRLIQVADVEVVSLCDVDKKMLAEAADLIGQRTKSDKKPRLYHDYREMLKEKDLDLVEVATPDHWHALPMIAAVEAGADKVSLNTAALSYPSLISTLAGRYGSQAVIVAIDAKRAGSGYSVYARSGRSAANRDAVEWAREAEARGAGEILLTSIDRDGTKAGFDCEMTAAVSSAVSIPVSA